MDVVLFLLLKLSRLVYGIRLDVGVFFPNRKLIITLGKKQKRKNESSDELSDAKQTPQRQLKDEDSQVSSENFSLLNLYVLLFLQVFFPLSPKSYTLFDTVTVTFSLLFISHRYHLTLSATFPS